MARKKKSAEIEPLLKRRHALFKNFENAIEHTKGDGLYILYIPKDGQPVSDHNFHDSTKEYKDDVVKLLLGDIKKLIGKDDD